MAQIDYSRSGTGEYSKYKDAFKYAPGSAAAQQMIGNSIDSAFAEGRLKRQEARRAKELRMKENLYNYRIGKEMAKDMDDLRIMGDTSSQDFNNVLQNGSRQIADYAGYLRNELKRTGDYNAYAEGMAKLKGEVTQMAGLKNSFNVLAEAYENGTANNTLSAYNSADLLANIEHMVAGGGGGSFGRVDGQQVWQGINANGDPYTIATSQFENLAKKLQKKDDINALLANSVKANRTPQGNILSFDQKPIGVDVTAGKSARELAEMELEALLAKTPGNKDRKAAAILVDHFGDTRELADARFDPANNTTDPDGPDGYKYLKEKWLERAESLYGVNQQAVQDYWHKAEDQKYQHREEKAQALQLARQQEETNRVFNNNTPAIWNTEIKPEGKDMNSMLGLIDRFKMDLNRVGLTGQELVFDDGETKYIPNEKGEIQQIINQAGEPRGIRVKNPLNPAGMPIFIPFNANPQEIQEAIRQANGMRVGTYSTGRRYQEDQLYQSGPKKGQVIPGKEKGKIIPSKYTQETATAAKFDFGRTPNNYKGINL